MRDRRGRDSGRAAALRRALILATLAGAALTAPTHAAVVDVDCSRQSLQAAIAAADPGDVLRVRGVCEGQFTITKRLTLDGHPSATLDAEDANRPLTIAAPGPVRLLDLVLTGGWVDTIPTIGGGILHTGGALTLRRVHVVDNHAAASPHSGEDLAQGGGIRSTGTSLTIVDSTVARNVALAIEDGQAEGGGVYATGAITILRSRFERNRAIGGYAGIGGSALGGGLALRDGKLTLTSTTFVRNRATVRQYLRVARGGGIDATGAQAEITIDRSTFEDNLVRGLDQASGGAIQGSVSELKIRRSRIVGSRAISAFAFGSIATGGALAAQGAAVRITSTAIRDSLTSGASGFEARSEGTVHAVGGSVRVDRSTVVSNRVVSSSGNNAASSSGGGLYTTGSLTVRTSKVNGNTAEATGETGAAALGGGIRSDGALSVRSSTLDGNVAEASGFGATSAVGGGIRADAGVTLEASTVSRNRASGETTIAGGGMALTGSGTAMVTNSTLTANQSSGSGSGGGGLSASSNYSVTLLAVSVARNRAEQGGGIQIAGTVNSARATILSSNTATLGPNCSGGTLLSQNYNLVGSMTGCTFAPQGSDRVGLAAKLGPLAANGGPTQTILPRPGSPALNWIPEAQCGVARDQRGVARPQGRRCDIGAVERRAGSRP